MLATQEQLIARWETAEGRGLAEEVRQALTPMRKPGRPVATPSGVVVAVEAGLRQRLARLPFADEVAPQLDLRGLHVSNHDLDLIHVDLTGARLDYVYEISIISECKLDGVVLDGCRAINGSFTGDFSQVSLAGAVLNGVTFRRVNLSGANMQGARLVKTNLREAVCMGASFVGADLRFSDCLRADFRGTDLREVDFTEASLANVLFDEQTRLQGANLPGARIKADFRSFAQQKGAILGESKNALDLAELDATIRMLQGSQDARLLIAIPYVIAVRDELVSNPEYSWGDALAEALSNAGYSELVDEVFEMWTNAGKGLGYYI